MSSKKGWPSLRRPARPSRAAADLQIHRNTALRWRHRFLRGLKAGRTARRRGAKAGKAGLSNELVCVLVARDRSGQTLDGVMGRGQMTQGHAGRRTAERTGQGCATGEGHKQPDLSLLCAGSANCPRCHQPERRRARQGCRPCPERQCLSRSFQAVAAPLSRRCHRVYPDNYLGWLRALDGHHADSGQAVLTTALGRFPHPTVT